MTTVDLSRDTDARPDATLPLGVAHPAVPLGAFTRHVADVQLPPHARQALSVAQLVATPPLTMLLRGAPHALGRRRIVAVDGPAGAGKSTGLAVLAAASPVPAHILSMRPRSTGRELMLALYESITGDAFHGGTQRDIENDLKVLLAAKPRIVLLDEAQNVGLAALQAIRFLLDLHTGQWGLVLAGKGILAKLAKEEMLANRVALRVTFPALNNANRTATVTALHPFLATAAPGLIDALDQLVCRGELRRWVILLEWMLQFAGPNEPCTAELAGEAALLMTGEHVPLPTGLA